MKKEVKIAIFAIVSLFLAIWGYKYIRGFNIFQPTNTIYALYDRVDGIRISTPVYIHGLQAGLVANMRQENENLNAIVVEIQLDKGIRIPKTAVAETVASVMGSPFINLVFSENCNGDDCAPSGFQIKGVTKSLLGSLASPEEVKVYMDQLNKGLKSAVDTLTDRLAESGDLQNSVKDVRTILTNLKQATGKLDKMLGESSGSIQKSLKNFEEISTKLKENSGHIENIIANADSLSGDLKDADVQGLSAEAKATFKKLQATLVTAEKTMNELGTVVSSMKSGDGALAKVLSDPEFAKSLEMTLKNLELLSQDFRLHPERYRRILSKKKMPYEKPENDPGHQ